MRNPNEASPARTLGGTELTLSTAGATLSSDDDVVVTVSDAPTTDTAVTGSSVTCTTGAVAGQLSAQWYDLSKGQLSYRPHASPVTWRKPDAASTTTTLHLDFGL